MIGHVWLNLLLFSSVLISIQGFHQSGYIVTSPSVFRSNVDHVINVRIFNHRHDVHVIAKLVDLREDLISSVRVDINTVGNLTLKVPAEIEGPAILTVCGNCHMNEGFRFSNRTTVTIVNTGSFALLQPDKPVYKPGQTVFINVFLLNRDLRPVNENVTIYVVTSNDARIMQWKNLKPACCGVINVSFPLSDQPVLGTWTLYAAIGQNLYNTTIEVQKYVLPKFEVAIFPPPFFRNQCENVTVEAMYVFGKPVVGRVKVNVSVEGEGYFRKQFLDRATPLYKDLEINRQATFPVCLDQLLPGDLPIYFRGHLRVHATVISETGSKFAGFDDSTPISRVKVDIDFSDDTRKHFKAGIPFTGKIVSTYLDGSPASHVLVRLIVNANRQEFIRLHLTSNERGIMTFTVPDVTDEIKFIELEAQVLTVDGVSVGSYGRSKTKYLYNWYSPSSCYILAENPREELQVHNRANVVIKSSCSCNFTLFYEVLSRGNIVGTGSRVVTPENNRIIQSRRKQSSGLSGELPFTVSSSRNAVPRHVCETTIQFDVTANMAPTSRVLVYYVKEDGEGVADSIVLPVRAQLENEVRVMTSPKQTSPGRRVDVEVTSSPGSCVCLAVVDRSVHILKPGYRINKDQIFNHVQDYDLDNSPPQDLWLSMSRTKRSEGWVRSQSPESRDAKHAFLESGLVVMTNVVSLNYKSMRQIFDHMTLQAMTYNAITNRENRRGEDRTRVTRRRRTFFPETWIWSCFNTSTGHDTFSLQVPDSVTTWRADAMAMNPESGVGISNPTMLRSMKNFFVDFNLPYSAIRGEAVQIPVTAYNYLDVCVEAVLQISLPRGVAFENSEERTLSRSFCVEPQTTETTNINLHFDHLGYKNLSASLRGFSQSEQCCEQSSSSQRTLVDEDSIMRKILVEAEGMKRRYSHSIYFCPNERINITTSNAHSYQFVRLPANQSHGFDFLVKAPRSVRIILAEEEEFSDRGYEIVLGGENNQQCWISKGSRKLLQAHYEILTPDAFKHFWISWADGNVQVGTGSTPNLSSRFMYVQQSNSDLSQINYIGFATADGATGEFRLWQREMNEKYSQQVINLSLPPNLVSHSERATASIIGDLMGPTLKNLNNLLSLPFGCGEQNLANFAPNVYVLKYLKGTRQMSEETRIKAIRYLQLGYQRQLTYKHQDGSYSAFGSRDFNGSMWLTAFVLKSFSQANEFIYIHPKELQDAMDWIVSWQRKDGAFPPVGKIWNKDIQAGVDSDVALTAYATVALIEAKCKDEAVMLNAKEYLEQTVRSPTDPYTASLCAYALTMLDSAFAEEARERLYSLARHDATTTYWSLRDGNSIGDDAAESMLFAFGDSLKQTVISAEIETTAFALLTFTKTENRTLALPMVRWLSKKRNAMGGFSSTQDTCVALQALSEYAVFSFAGGINLRVILDCTTDCSNQFLLNNENDKVLQSMPVEVPTVMFVNAFGVGCALMQVDVSYNIPVFDDRPSFYIRADINQLIEEESNGQLTRNDNIVTSLSSTIKSKYELTACVQWLGTGSSNMAVLELSLLTGFEPDRESLEKLLDENNINLKRYEIEDQAINFYFDEVFSSCRTCVRFLARKNFATTNTKPRSAKVYDYYEPRYQSEVMYSEGEVGESAHRQEDNDRAQAEVPECKCRHDCGFSGPSVCGNNSVIYLNQCRMTAAACEAGAAIVADDTNLCQTQDYTNEYQDQTDPLQNLFEGMNFPMLSEDETPMNEAGSDEAYQDPPEEIIYPNVAYQGSDNP